MSSSNQYFVINHSSHAQNHLLLSENLFTLNTRKNCINTSVYPISCSTLPPSNSRIAMKPSRINIFLLKKNTRKPHISCQTGKGKNVYVHPRRRGAHVARIHIKAVLESQAEPPRRARGSFYTGKQMQIQRDFRGRAPLENGVCAARARAKTKPSGRAPRRALLLYSGGVYIEL